MNGLQRFFSVWHWGALKIELMALLAVVCCPWGFEAPNAHADTRTVIVQGLTFRCESCSVDAEPTCQVTFANGSELLRCDEAVPRLLADALQADPAGEFPSAVELRKYLLGAEPNPNALPLVLTFLARTTSGQRVLIIEAATFALKYEDDLATFFLSGAASADVLQAYWKLPGTEGIPLKPRTKAALASRLTTLSAKDLFAELSGSDPKKDETDLVIFAETLAEVRPELATIMKQASALVAVCSEIPLSIDDPGDCSESALATLPEAAKNYLRQTQVSVFLSKVSLKKHSTRQIFLALRRLDYQNYRTPKLHELFLAMLDATMNADESERAEFWEPENQNVIDVFSKNDKRIAYGSAQILSRAAADRWDAKDYPGALKLLDRSFDIYAERIANRAKIVDQLAAAKEILERPGLKERLHAIVAKSTDVVAEKTNWFRIFVILLVIGSCGMWGVFLFIFLKRRRSDEFYGYVAEGQSDEGTEEELLELCDFFEISPEDGEYELTKSFHRKAKESHPDVAEGEGLEFRAISEKYHRARQLLTQRITHRG